ncbi:MAG: hypothetical protein ACJARG_000782, partial [Arcticibacterium sp.]
MKLICLFSLSFFLLFSCKTGQKADQIKTGNGLFQLFEEPEG